MKFLKNLQNKADFFLRRNIRFSREYKGSNEDKENLFAHLPESKIVSAKEKELLYFQKYRLDYLKNNSTRRNYLENLDTIELLENYIWVGRDNLKILDIGSKNWFYATGEHNFFKYNNFEKEIWIDSIEIDAFRVYANFHTRYDYARYYSKNLKNCSYIAEDLMRHYGKYDYITWFFPFVSEFPHLKWGLPLSVFKPLEMLEHAASLLNPGGVLLIVNQDENEYYIQEDLLKKAGLNYVKKGEFKSSFLKHQHKKYVTLVT